MDPVSEERFYELVDDACDLVPDELWDRLDNVAIVVEDEHPDDPELLGLYEGTPQTARGDEAWRLPDRIAIYRLPLCALCADDEELIDEVAVTVVHEIAHHLGIEEDRLHELGWD